MSSIRRIKDYEILMSDGSRVLFTPSDDSIKIDYKPLMAFLKAMGHSPLEWVENKTGFFAKFAPVEDMGFSSIDVIPVENGFKMSFMLDGIPREIVLHAHAQTLPEGVNVISKKKDKPIIAMTVLEEQEELEENTMKAVRVNRDGSKVDSFVFKAD